MKKYFYCLLAAVAMVAASCEKEIAPDDALTLGSSTYAVPSAGSVETISFESNTAWTIAAESADWIAFDRTSGEAGSASVKMTVSANTSYEARSAKVTITAGDKKTVLNVQQASAVSVGTSTVYKIDAKAQTIEVAISSSEDYQVKVADGIDWITVVSTKALVEGTIVLRVAAHANLSPRTGSFTVVAGSYSQTYEVVQDSEYLQASSASACFIGNIADIYNDEDNSLTSFRQFAAVLKTDDGDEVTLVVNKKAPVDSTVFPAGEYEIDATGARNENTFSIKSLDGHEKHYTSIVSGGKEISVIDGIINVEEADAVYTITAVLLDAAEQEHRYSYQGALAVEDESFGANQYDAPSFKGSYNTYFATKANEWSISFHLSRATSPDSKYVSYVSVNFFSAPGDLTDLSIPAGEFKYVAEEDILISDEVSYKNGKMKAEPGTFYFSYLQLANGHIAKIKEGTTPKFGLVKNSDGTYDITLEATCTEWGYDESWTKVELDSNPFTVSGTAKGVYFDAAEVTIVPLPDGDIVLKSGFNPAYTGLWWGDAFGDGGNVFTMNFSYFTDGNVNVYATIEMDETYDFYSSMLNSRISNAPILPGTYTFSATSGHNTLLPVGYGTSNAINYNRIENAYTGTNFKITGGSITFAKNGECTFDVQATATAKDQTINVTGTFLTSSSSIQNFTARASNLHLPAVE